MGRRGGEREDVTAAWKGFVPLEAVEKEGTGQDPYGTWVGWVSWEVSLHVRALEQGGGVEHRAPHT